jgi:hypothetical protein
MADEFEVGPFNPPESMRADLDDQGFETFATDGVSAIGLHFMVFLPDISIG